MPVLGYAQEACAFAQAKPRYRLLMKTRPAVGLIVLLALDRGLVIACLALALALKVYVLPPQGINVGADLTKIVRAGAGRFMGRDPLEPISSHWRQMFAR
jgi:hypothetical protein